MASHLGQQHAAIPTSSSAPNPLRPYYVPAVGDLSVGGAMDPLASVGDAGSHVQQRSSRASFGSAARDMLADIEYGDYLPDAAPSVGDVAKKLMDQATWKFASVFLAQPFEVAKLTLQCHLAAPAASRGKTLLTPRRRSAAGQRRARAVERSTNYDDCSDDDAPSYFSSYSPELPRSYADGRESVRLRSRSRSSTPSPSPSSPGPGHKLQLRNPNSVTEALGQLWAREGVWGVWKGTNATFFYGILYKTIDSWTRSLLSASLNLPDPMVTTSGSLGAGLGGLDILESRSPLASLLVAVASAGVAGILLAPLDIIRTRLILTSSTSTPRSLLPSLRALDSFICPWFIAPITMLHTTIPTFLSVSIPFVLRSSFRIDPVLTPTLYSIATFVASAVELFIKLPLETVLKRAHYAELQQQQRRRTSKLQRGALPSPSAAEAGEIAVDTIVDVGPYHGPFRTMWFIVREEGERELSAKPATRDRLTTPTKHRRKGQGVFGLWRGWRVGFWGLVGVWGAAAFGSTGGEF